MQIVEGDHGLVIPFTVSKGKIENIEGASVEVAIMHNNEIKVVQATILDPVNAKCQFLLTSDVLTGEGTYYYQWTCFFEDGIVWNGKTKSFYASDKLVDGIPGGTTVPVIVPFVRMDEFEELKYLVEQGGGGTVPSNVILFENWVGGESVTIDVSTDTTPPTLTITAGGTFTGTKTVTMSTNETATIYYTLDGSTPTTSSPVYTTPLPISATTTLKAFAKDTSGNQSAIQNVTYTLDSTPPTDTTPPDNVTNLTHSNLAQTSLTLNWTVSASSDVASYDVYKGATLLANVTGTTYNVTGLTASTEYTFTVKAKDGANNVASGTSVTVTTSAPVDTTAPVLTITPAGTFTDTQIVTMSTNETAIIWYTLDDSDPITSGTRLQYTAPLTLTETDTVKAYAVDSANNVSAVQTVIYAKQSAGSFTTISDSFNRADSTLLGTTDTGQIWTQHSDVKYGVRGNRAYQSQQVSGGAPRYRKVPYVTSPSGDYAIEVTLSTIETSVDGKESIQFRFNNPAIAAYDGLMVYRNGTSAAAKYLIGKWKNSSYSTLKTGTKTPANGDRIRVENKSDGTINVYVNGVLDSTVVDTDFLTNRNVGLGCETSVSEWDDFEIKPLT